MTERQVNGPRLLLDFPPVSSSTTRRAVFAPVLRNPSEKLLTNAQKSYKIASRYIATHQDASRRVTTFIGLSRYRQLEEVIMARWHRYEWEAKGERWMGKGDFKYVILDLLKDKPSHGYEIIRTLEERFRGFYAPSAGVVYPTLQMLEEMGYVTAVEQDGKKTYTVTEEGRRFLADNQRTVDDIKERMGGWWGWSPESALEMRDMARDLRDFGRSLAHQAHRASPEKLHRIKEVINRAYRDIEAIINE
jgi:DNA-binding PadR family transcriptional regulator